jgi:hypothetical protein
VKDRLARQAEDGQTVSERLLEVRLSATGQPDAPRRMRMIDEVGERVLGMALGGLEVQDLADPTRAQ